MIRWSHVSDSAVQSAGPARGRMEDIRRALAATADPAARGRIRARLADALAASGDLGAAAAELRQAAAEAPASVALMFGVRALSSRLGPAEAPSFLDAVGGDAPGARHLGGRAAADRGAGQRGAAPGRHAAGARAAGPARPLRRGAAGGEPPRRTASIRRSRRSRRESRCGPGASPRRWRARAELGEDRLARLQELVEALARAGARRQALFLARTLAEIPGDGTVTLRAGESLSGLVARALETNDAELALRWGADLGRPLAQLSRAEPRAFVGPRDTFEKRFRSAQAALAVAQTERERAAALDPLLPLLSGSRGGLAALALASALAGEARASGTGVPVRPAELLRTALDQEATARGRARLGAGGSRPWSGIRRPPWRASRWRGWSRPSPSCRRPRRWRCGACAPRSCAAAGATPSWSGRWRRTRRRPPRARPGRAAGRASGPAGPPGPARSCARDPARRAGREPGEPGAAGPGAPAPGGDGAGGTFAGAGPPRAAGRRRAAPPGRRRCATSPRSPRQRRRIARAPWRPGASC